MAQMMGGGNFSITGGGHCQTGTNNVAIWSPSVSSTWWDKVSLTNFGCADVSASNFGASFGFANKYTGIYTDAFGASACFVNGLNVILTDSYCGESKYSALVIGGANTTLRTHNFYLAASLSNIGIWVGKGAANVRWFSMQDQNYGSIGVGGTQIYVDATATVYLDKWYGGGTAYDVVLTPTGKAHIRDSVFSGTTACIGSQGATMTTGALFDDGGNVCSSNNVENKLIPTCPAVTGAGATGSCAVIVPGSTNEKGTLRVTVAGAGPAATGTVTMNFGGTFGSSAPGCSYNLAGTGTGAWNARGTVFLTTRSATAPVLTWDNNLVALTANTWDIDYECTARSL